MHLWKRGKKYYIVYQDALSVQIKRSIGTDYRAGSKLCMTVNEMLLAGKDPLALLDGEVNPGTITLSQFFPMFMERHGSQQSARMQGTYQERFRWISESKLVSVPMVDVTKKMVYDYMNHRILSSGVGPATANMELKIIKTMFARAIEWEVIPVNPVEKIIRLKEPPKRNVYLTEEQVCTLVEALPPTIGYIVEFAIYTGLRKDNILGLTIDQIDRAKSVVNLVIKGGHTESFHLSENALAVALKSINDRRDGLVFPAPGGVKYNTRLQSFQNAVDKLGLSVGDGRLHFHDLRHVYGSWLADAGVSMDLIRLLMGHKNRSTTDRYVTMRTGATVGLSDLIPTIRKDK